CDAHEIESRRGMWRERGAHEGHRVFATLEQWLRAVASCGNKLSGGQISEDAFNAKGDRIGALDTQKAAVPVGYPLRGNRQESGQDDSHQREGRHGLEEAESCYIRGAPTRGHGTVLRNRTVSIRNIPPEGDHTVTATTRGAHLGRPGS